MGWLKIESGAAKKASQVTVTLSVRKSGKGMLIFSWPSSLAVEFQRCDTIDVFFGDGEDEGKVMFLPTEKGAFKRALLKKSVVVRMAVPKGIPLKRNVALVPYTWDGQAIIVPLPYFARKGHDPYKATGGTSDGGKPGSLELNGSVLTLGTRNLMVSKHEAIILDLLIKRFGQCVAKAAILDALYGDDPNGGAQAKIVDVWISKLRSKIEAAGMELLIVTHRGMGWELKRPVS